MLAVLRGCQTTNVSMTVSKNATVLRLNERAVQALVIGASSHLLLSL